MLLSDSSGLSSKLTDSLDAAFVAAAAAASQPAYLAQQVYSPPSGRTLL